MTSVPEQECPRLSLGIDSTLGNWRDLTASIFGEQSAATEFWDTKIREQGRDEWVVSDEQQTLALVATLHRQAMEKRSAVCLAE